MIRIKRNDKRAKTIIWLTSILLFIAITALGRVELKVELGFDKHVFALINAIINSTVSFLLILGLVAIKLKKKLLHQNIMLSSMVLSVLFLLSYVCHHLFTGSAQFGGDGAIRFIYYALLFSHILLAALILPFILFTSYRSLVGDFEKHKKLARITWPIWFYVSVSGVIVYFLISPYYG